MYCKLCGKEITDDSKFCQHCGGKLDNIEQWNSTITTNRGQVFIETNKMDKAK